MTVVPPSLWLHGLLLLISLHEAAPAERSERFDVALSSLPHLPLVYCLSLCPLSAGEVLFQMAEVHRQIQIQLEEMVSMWQCCWCC